MTWRRIPLRFSESPTWYRVVEGMASTEMDTTFGVATVTTIGSLIAETERPLFVFVTLQV